MIDIDNGGPATIEEMISKIASIRAVLNSWNYTQTEALIAIGLIIETNADYEDATPSAETLQRFAKTRTRNPVFKALQDLETELNVITRKRGGFGLSNTYNVLPQRIIDSVVDHFTDVQRRKINNPSKTRTPPEKKASVVRPNRTTAKPPVVRSNGTPFVPSNDTPVVPSNDTTDNSHSYGETIHHSYGGTVRHSYGPTVHPSSITSSKEDSLEEVAREKNQIAEIEGLNGNTIRFVTLLAEAENQFAPDLAMARDLIQSNVNHYGADVVAAGFLQWQQALANKSDKNRMKNPFRSLANYISTIAENRSKTKPSKREAVGTSFSDRLRAQMAADQSGGA